MPLLKRPSLKPYRLLEHTADISLRVRSSDLKGLFENAASATFEIMASRIAKAKVKELLLEIRLQAVNKEELFVSWLNELISLSAVKGLVFKRFSIKKMDERKLSAVVKGERIRNYKLDTEIKAATFNGLLIKRGGSGWLAEVTFDV